MYIYNINHRDYDQIVKRAKLLGRNMVKNGVSVIEETPSGVEIDGVRPPTLARLLAAAKLCMLDATRVEILMYGSPVFLTEARVIHGDGETTFKL